MDPALAASLPKIAWVVFAGAMLLSNALGCLLAYHWFRYAMNKAMSITMLVIYSFGGALLLSILLAATIAISNV